VRVIVVTKGILEQFRVAEDMPIESELVVNALDKVQTQVEDYFKATRQQIFRLDEVTSFQRSAVYSQRRAFLTSSDEGEFVFDQSVL
jgi:preprotein translocase subunit SecA